MARGKILEGSGRDDRLSGGSGDDQILGRGGDDRLEGEAGDDTIAGGDGEDRIDGASGDDSLDGGARDDRIEGGSGADTLAGGSGDDRLEGGSGRDVLIGGSGDDTLDGGSGDDVVVFDGPASSLTISWLRNGDIEVRGPDGTDRLTDVEALNIGGTVYQLGGKGAILKDDRASMTENQTIAIDVLDNDFALRDGAAMTLQKLGGGKAANGDLVAKTAEGAEVRYQNGKLAVDPKTAFDSLAKGQTVTTSFIYAVSTGGVVNQAEVKLTVTGVNDAATIKATSPGSDAGAAKPAQLTAAGQLTVIDPDQGESVFKAPASMAGAYGTFSFDTATGVWGYTADPAKLAGLTGNAVETLTVASKDGTDIHAIKVTVTGGTTGPQPIVGDDGPNSLAGTAGNDTIDGKGGEDTLDGGLGDDRLFGGAGNDILLLQGGGFANGGVGHDTVTGVGASTVSGEEGDDFLRLFTGGGTALGGAGDDRLYSGAGNDSLDGGAGTDVAYFAYDVMSASFTWLPGNVLQVTGPGGGLDTVHDVEHLSFNNFVLTRQSAPPIVRNDTGALNEGQTVTLDVLANDVSLADDHALFIQKAGFGDAANGSLVATGPGGATVTFQDGKLVYNPGTAFDYLTVGQTTTTSFNYVVRNTTGQYAQATVNLTVTGISNAPANLVLTGDDSDNTLTGGAGNDTIDGKGGVFDRLDGGGGHDLLKLDGGGTMNGGAGDDTLQGGLNDTWPSGAEARQLWGDAGDDSLTLGALGGMGFGGSGDDTIQAGSGPSYIYGFDGNDYLIGGSYAVLQGDGGTGADTAVGGANADEFYFSELGTEDWIDGGASYDTGGGQLGEGGDVIVLSADGRLTLNGVQIGVNLERIVVAAGGGNDTLESSGFLPDKLWGQAGDDRIVAGGGTSQALGHEGNDTIIMGSGGGHAGGGDGADTVQGGSFGGDLWGDGGDDLILAGTGGDWLTGSSGSDTMVGGVGDDSFFLHSDSAADRIVIAPGGGGDRVFDLMAGDVIDLSAFRIAYGTAMDAFSDLNLVGNVLTLPGGGTVTFFNPYGPLAAVDFDFG